MWCGGASDCSDSPAYGYASVQSGRDIPGIDSAVLAASVNGGVAQLSSTANSPYAVAGGYPSSINQAGSMANALTQTSPDYPTPTALTVAQAFQGMVPGDAQPGYVLLPGLNWTADNLSFVKPLAGPACPVTNWLNSNPLLVIAGAFAVAYLAAQHGKRRRAA